VAAVVEMRGDICEYADDTHNECGHACNYTK
jgi:hypothetical protein